MRGGLDSRAITVINLDFWAGARKGGEGDVEGRGGILWSGSIFWFVVMICRSFLLCLYAALVGASIVLLPCARAFCLSQMSRL